MALVGNVMVSCSGGYLTIHVFADSAGSTNQTVTISVTNVTDGVTSTWASGGGFPDAQHTFENLAIGKQYLVTVTGSSDGAGTISPPEYSGTFIGACPCTIGISILNSTSDRNAQSIGKITVYATSTAGGVEYSLTGLDDDYFPGVGSTPYEFSGLPSGNYVVYARDADGCLDYQNVTVGNIGCDLSQTAFSKTDETGVLGDGTATITATTSAGGLQYKLDSGLWVNGTSGTPYVFDPVGAGDHIIYIRDAASCTSQKSFTIIAYVDTSIPFVSVPSINSLRFVPSVTIDNCSVFQTPDNTLFSEQVYPGYKNLCYMQKVNKCDTLIIQWQSNYDENWIELTNMRTGSVYEFEAEPATLPDDYVLPTEYDIIESVIDWTSVPNGYYAVKIKGDDPTHGEYEFLGEPIDLKTNHEGTVLIAYKNFESAFDCEYLTGIVHRLRIPSRFFQVTNPGKRTVYKDSLNRTIKLKGIVERRIKLEVFLIPPYLHEKLAKVFEHDLVTVNGVEFQTEENYEIKYFNLFMLANGEIDLTQVNFNNTNSDDSGSVDIPSGGFLSIEDGLLKL